MSISQSKTENESATGVDPARVPGRVLSSGAKIPVIGLGTFGSDKYSAQQIAGAVVDAAAVGYRHFDCAEVYGNEKEIGMALREVLRGGDGRAGIKREELWITSKLWNNHHAERDVIPACEKSLAELQLDYLDLYMIHWPFPNYHAPGCDVSSRSADARPYIHADYMQTWRQMEKLVERGLVKHIGTSNMTIPKMELLLRDAAIRPAVNELELHPHLQQPELFDYLVQKNILPIGFCPLGSPSRPERDRTPGDTVDMEDPVIVEVAARRGLSPADVCLKWGVQRGEVVIPFSVKRSQYLSSLRAMVSAPLSSDEMQAIAQIDKNCRLVKGQVFLWKENQTWEALWDLDGTITPA